MTDKQDHIPESRVRTRAEIQQELLSLRKYIAPMETERERRIRERETMMVAIASSPQELDRRMKDVWKFINEKSVK